MSLLQKVLCSSNDFCLFIVINGLRAISIPVVGPKSYLDEHQRTIIGHDKVKFSDPTAVISFHQLQAVSKQVTQCSGFGQLPLLLSSCA